MTFYSETPSARLEWGEMDEQITTALPFRVRVNVVGEDKEILEDYSNHLTISAVTAKVCLAENFEGGRLGLW